jgi:acetyltransferase-like isoleucine patch superfamily enzyme
MTVEPAPTIHLSPISINGITAALIAMCDASPTSVIVGEASHIAINAAVIPLIEIGERCIVGAGSTVNPVFVECIMYVI